MKKVIICLCFISFFITSFSSLNNNFKKNSNSTRFSKSHYQSTPDFLHLDKLVLSNNDVKNLEAHQLLFLKRNALKIDHLIYTESITIAAFFQFILAIYQKLFLFPFHVFF